jgi:predicted SnoaL-like aldol condensation-catalyzing enzyme
MKPWADESCHYNGYQETGGCMQKANILVLFLASAWCASAWANPQSLAVCEPSAKVNRDLVLSFFKQGLIDRQPRSAFGRYVSPDFVEHKPDVPVGSREAAVVFLEGLMKDLPDARWEVLRTVSEENLVFIHARFTPAPGAPSYAIADLFRLDNCAIVEHWDVVGPPRDGQPNPHSRY